MTEHVGYRGTGIWVRISHRFRARLTEWLLAFIMFNWGAVISLPGDLFTIDSFAGFRLIFGSEWVVSAIMLSVGAVRLAGLIVNGSMQEVTPHIRMVSAAVGAVIWTGISYCFAESGHIGTWAAVYPTFALMELGNVYLAAYDVGSSRNGTGRIR